MKKYLSVFLILILLILDFLALDDITTGNEPNYFGEYIILLISVLIFGFLIHKHFAKHEKN